MIPFSIRSEEALNLMLAVEFLVIIGFGLWRTIYLYRNRNSQWTYIGVVNGIEYRQHKVTGRRDYYQIPVRGNLDLDWINGKSDTLKNS
jgi:hypothetical protein